MRIRPFPSPHGGRRSPSDFFADLAHWRDFLDASGLAERTCTQYRYFFLRFLADVLIDPADVTEDDVTHYLASIKPKGHQAQGILRALKSHYSWGCRRGLYAENPAEPVRFKSPKYPPAVSLSPDELERVLEVLRRHRNPRRAWTIELAVETGARIGSLAGVKPDDVGTSAGEPIHFNVAKGDRPYAVPLSPTAAGAVRKLLPGANGTLLGVHSNTIWRWYHDAAVKARLPKKKHRAHVLRDTFATTLLERGTNPRVVQELLNHSDLSQLHRYTAVVDGAKRAALSDSIYQRSEVSGRAMISR